MWHDGGSGCGHSVVVGNGILICVGVGFGSVGGSGMVGMGLVQGMASGSLGLGLSILKN